MTITMIPLECGAPEAFENPNPAVAERAVCFDPHSGRPLLVAEKKGLHRLQWMRTLRFMSFFFPSDSVLWDAQIGQHF